MALIETESLILKSYNLAEADKIVVLFTRDHGVVRGVAKGAKRLKSKFGSGLEPFTTVRVEYFQKEAVELVSIQKVELVKSYFSAASDPDFLHKFTYLADLLVAFSPPHDPNEKLYRMTKACLETADADRVALLAVGVYFELWLLRLAGLLPDWSACVECRRPIADGETADLTSNFHLICSNCRRSRSSRTVESGHRDMFTSARQLSPSEFARANADRDGELSELSRILKSIISQAVGREVANERVGGFAKSI